MKKETKFLAEDQFLNLISKVCRVEDQSEIVDLFYKCIRFSYEEGYDDGKFKAYSQLERDIHGYPDMEDEYV